MICLCMKEKLLEKYECNPLLLNFSLMACSWCKRKQNDNYEVNDDNKYQMMFIESLFCTMRQIDEVIMRIYENYLLEEIQDKFEVDKKCDEEIHNFMNIVERLQNGKNSNFIADLNEFYGTLSEYSFLELVKRLIFVSNFSVAQRVILDYFIRNVTIFRTTFRKRFYFRVKESDVDRKIVLSSSGAKFQYYTCDPFFDIGWALDEGLTESNTQQVMKRMSNDYQPDTKYFFEVKYYNKLMSLFDEDKKESMKHKIEFENYATTLIFNLMKYSDDRCDFYNLYYYTDNQKWKEANLLLNKVMSLNIDVESL